MATCKSCGAELKPNAKFCPECGTVIEEATVLEKEDAKPAEAEAASTPDTAEKAAEIKSEKPAEQKAPETEKKAEDEIEKTIEAAAEAAAELPQVKEISIIKPKDISVLKPKRTDIIQKKPTTPPPAPIPTAAAAKAAEITAKQDQEADKPEEKVSHKRIIPDVELPEEPKMPESSDDTPLPVVSSFMSKREDDFGKDFYSDNSIKNKPSVNTKPEEPKPAEIAPKKEAAPAAEHEKKKKSPVGAIIAIIVIIAAAGAGFYLYTQGYFGGSKGSDTQPVAETTVYPASESESLSDTVSETDTESSESTDDSSTADSSATSPVSSETSASSESISDTSPASDTNASPVAGELSDLALTFTHTQSVGGSEILNYSFANNSDSFSISNMTDTSQLIVDFVSSVETGNNVSPVNMYISDGTSKEAVSPSSVTENQVTYDYSIIRETAEAVGYADGINSIVSISFSGVGFPVDINSIVVTNYIS